MSKGREDWPLEARAAEKEALLEAADWREIAQRWRQKWRDRRVYVSRCKVLERKVEKLEERGARRAAALREAKEQVAALNAQVTRLQRDANEHVHAAKTWEVDRKELLKQIETVSGIGAKESAKASILVRSLATRLGIATSTSTGRRWESPKQLTVDELAKQIDQKLVEYMRDA